MTTEHSGRPNLRPLSLHLAVLLALIPGVVLGQPSGGVSLAGTGHDVGKNTAKVYIVEFADFGCGYCAKFSKETYPSIDSAYIRTGRVFWKYVPFVTGMFKNSREAAEAAECAAQQNGFWAMHDVLYERRKEWMASKDPVALLTRYAQDAKLDAKQLNLCLKTRATRERIARNDLLANALYIRGTPTFFVNGQAIPGAIPFDLFKQVIAAAEK
jgi:protein-disulfide isomerase